MKRQKSILENIKLIKKIADKYQWQHLCTQENISMISFKKQGWRVNIYYSKGTVGTSINHPQHGRTQFFRRGIYTAGQLKDIFQNPRVHTGKGYYMKNGQMLNQLKK